MMNENDLAAHASTRVLQGDYDLRYPIHICASEGEVETAIFLLKIAKGDKEKISCKDRWGGTPLGDAERGLKKDPESHAFQEVVRLFREAGGVGDERGHFETIDIPLNESPEAVEIIEAAAGGDMVEMRKYGTNPNLFSCDYDSRTALHLAASNGHLNIIKWLLGKMDNSEMVRNAGSKETVMSTLSGDEDGESTAAEKADRVKNKILKWKAKLGIINYQDRFYGTPIMDTEREGHPEVKKELEKWNAKCNSEIQKLEEKVNTIMEEGDTEDVTKEEDTKEEGGDDDAAAPAEEAAAAEDNMDMDGLDPASFNPDGPASQEA